MRGRIARGAQLERAVRRKHARAAARALLASDGVRRRVGAEEEAVAPGADAGEQRLAFHGHAEGLADRQHDEQHTGRIRRPDLERALNEHFDFFDKFGGFVTDTLLDRELMDRFDADGDGFVDKGEFLQGVMAELKIRALFEACDFPLAHRTRCLWSAAHKGVQPCP